jgi:hypothetical protein
VHHGRSGVALQSIHTGSVGHTEQSISSQNGRVFSGMHSSRHAGRNGSSLQPSSVGSITSSLGAGVGGVGGLVGTGPVHRGVSRARSPSLVTACPAHVEQ